MTTLDAPNAELRRCLAFEAGRARGLLGSGERLRAAIGGRVGTAIGVFARGGLAALDALEDAGWDIFSRRPRTVPLQARPGRRHRPRAMTSVEQAYAEVERLTRARARNFAYGIMLLPKPKRCAIAAIYAFAREVDDIADEERARRRGQAAAARGATGAAHRRPGRRSDAGRARRRTPEISDPTGRSRRPHRGWTPGHSSAPLRDVRRASGLLPARRRGGRRRVCRRLRRPTRDRARRDARHRAPADQHHSRREGGLGARARLSAAGRARRARRVGGGHRASVG